MRFDIRHTTTYTYPHPVRGSQQMLRLQPISRSHQRVIVCSLAILPMPASRHDVVDFFGNWATAALIAEAHRELAISTHARIDIDRPPLTAPTPRWEDVRASAAHAQDLSPESPVHFIFASPLVPLLPPIRDYVQQSFPNGRSIFDAVLDVAQRMKADFNYDPAATDVATPIAQSFAARAGVCQDFAHIMIAGLRALGLPAAYVSGYLRTDPPPGQSRLEGVDAMHAWVRVWCGADAGWREFDPTNGIAVANDHVILAIGRDYSDVSPVVGAIRSAGEHSISVAVDVVPSPQ